MNMKVTKTITRPKGLEDKKENPTQTMIFPTLTIVANTAKTKEN